MEHGNYFCKFADSQRALRRVLLPGAGLETLDELRDDRPLLTPLSS